MKFKAWIHDHVSQISAAITFGVGFVTQSLHDTALAGLIASAAAFVVKLITPKP